jgi:hypothetical protein
MSPADAKQILAEAIQAGIDLEMLEYNLGLSPEERARQHDAALVLVLELAETGERMRANDLALA